MCGQSGKRQKRISLRSVAPLDRLLNQATELDEITVRVGCSTTKGTPINDRDESYVYINNRYGHGLEMNHYDFTFEVDNVNKVTCLNHEEDP
jgi:hypothetical protein